MHVRRRRARILGLPAFSVACLLLASCGGGDEYNYSVPDKICGVDVDPESLEPLLSPGDALETRPITDDAKPGNCEILIGSRPDIRFRVWLFGEYYADPAEQAEEIQLAEPRSVDVGAQGMVGTNGGTTSFRCHEDSQPDDSETITTDITLFEDNAAGGENERTDRLGDLLRSFVAGVRELYECDA